ncbi:MAG: DUF222 domain-containing protein [Microbacterium sp.]
MSVLIHEIEKANRARNRADAAETKALAELNEIADAQDMRIASSGGSGIGWPHRAIAEEVAGATGQSSITVQRKMNDALLLTRFFKNTFFALAKGELSAGHARVIIEHGERLDEQSMAAYEDEMLKRYRQAPMPTGRLRPVAKHIAEYLMCEPLDVRHARAKANRYVIVAPEEDAMSKVTAYIPSVLAAGIYDRVTQMGKTLKSGRTDETDERGLDELRADVFCDLLLAGAPATDLGGALGRLGDIQATVQATIPLKKITEPSAEAEPAFLEGYGPIDTASASAFAWAASTSSATGLWQRLFTDTDTGVLLTVDQYRPTAAQKRFLNARDEHCRFPGCRRKARRCDADHTIPSSQGGETNVGNLERVCGYHHLMRHNTAWKPKQLPGGVIEWTSPTGTTYIDKPPPVVRFVPSDDKAPF